MFFRVNVGNHVICVCFIIIGVTVSLSILMLGFGWSLLFGFLFFRADGDIFVSFVRSRLRVVGILGVIVGFIITLFSLLHQPEH